MCTRLLGHCLPGISRPHVSSTQSANTHFHEANRRVSMDAGTGSLMFTTRYDPTRLPNDIRFCETCVLTTPHSRCTGAECGVRRHRVSLRRCPANATRKGALQWRDTLAHLSFGRLQARRSPEVRKNRARHLWRVCSNQQSSKMTLQIWCPQPRLLLRPPLEMDVTVSASDEAALSSPASSGSSPSRI